MGTTAAKLFLWSILGLLLVGCGGDDSRRSGAAGLEALFGGSSGGNSGGATFAPGQVVNGFFRAVHFKGVRRWLLEVQIPNPDIVIEPAKVLVDVPDDSNCPIPESFPVLPNNCPYTDTPVTLRISPNAAEGNHPVTLKWAMMDQQEKVLKQDQASGTLTISKTPSVPPPPGGIPCLLKTEVTAVSVKPGSSATIAITGVLGGCTSAGATLSVLKPEVFPFKVSFDPAVIPLNASSSGNIIITVPSNAPASSFSFEVRASAPDLGNRPVGTALLVQTLFPPGQ